MLFLEKTNFRRKKSGWPLESLFIFWKTHFWRFVYPSFSLFGNLGFVVLAREQAPLNPCTHENDNKESKSNSKVNGMN